MIPIISYQLLGYRSLIPGLTYLPSKPRKYGLKLFWICDASSGFGFNGKLYIGRKNDSVHRNLGCDVVMELSTLYYKLTMRSSAITFSHRTYMLACRSLRRAWHYLAQFEIIVVRTLWRISDTLHLPLVSLMIIKINSDRLAYTEGRQKCSNTELFTLRC